MGKIKKEEEAEEFYKKSINENPKFPYSYLNYSILYREKNKFRRAIEIISEGIKENPNQGFLYYNRACFYVNIKELHKAFEDLNKAIDLDYIFEEYMKEDEELNPLRGLEEYIELYGNDDKGN